jgi:hypothetical protein
MEYPVNSLSRSNAAIELPRISFLGPSRPEFIFQALYPVGKVLMPFLHSRYLEVWLVVHLAKFGLDWLEAELFENQEMYQCALLEPARRVRCTFNISVMARFTGFEARVIARHEIGDRTDSFFWVCSQNLRRHETPLTADNDPEVPTNRNFGIMSVSAGRSNCLHQKGEENQNVKNDDGKNSQKGHQK